MECFNILNLTPSCIYIVPSILFVVVGSAGERGFSSIGTQIQREKLIKVHFFPVIVIKQVHQPIYSNFGVNIWHDHVVKDARLGIYTWRSQALWGRVGSGQKGLGFSLCAVPSQLAGPHISELGQSWVETEVQVEDRVEIRSRVKDQRFEVRGGDGGRALSQRYQIFTKRSIESIWVVDLIFELRSIHVREVAYKRWETIGRYFRRIREMELLSDRSHVQEM
jgi:hypothetical protein